MMKNYSFLGLVFTLIFTSCVTNKPVTVVPTNYDISDNLDLQAVASIFGDSNSLEDFERRLNDPEFKISNLDLNKDGYVDYLRIIESIERGTHLVTIQAALGNDLFQDVATIDVERDQFDKPYVQFVGHPYFYGPRYIIEPVFINRPLIFNSFWAPNYRAYYSPYYFNYYPSYYSYWNPIPVRQYVTNVYVYRNQKNTYYYAQERRSQNATALVRDSRRDDYVSNNQDQGFTARNNQATNKRALETSRRSSTGNAREANATPQRRDTRDSQNTNKTKTSTSPRTRTPERRPSTSERKPSTQPRTGSTERKPSTQPRTRKPSSTPNTRKPSSTPSTRKSTGETTKRKNTRSERD